MSLIDYMTAHAPITNLPDLLGWGHHNPLGIPLWLQLAFIFVVVTVMQFVDFKIRKRGKSNWYPALYALFGVSLAAIYYYCFLAEFPKAFVSGFGVSKPCIGWFCQPDLVGWGRTIVGVLVLAHIVYSLLCAVMQIVAQLTVEAHLVEGKVWKEWKYTTYLALLGVAVCGLSYLAGPVACSWTLLVFQVVLLAAVIVKMVADCRRMERKWWGVLIAAVYYIGIIAVVMLTVECMRGTLALFVVLLAWFSSAKASKKNPKKK